MMVTDIAARDIVKQTATTSAENGGVEKKRATDMATSGKNDPSIQTLRTMKRDDIDERRRRRSTERGGFHYSTNGYSSSGGTS
jgi:hypothetical protein